MKNVRWAKIFLRQEEFSAHLTFFLPRHGPTGIEARQGFAHIKSVRVEGDGAPGKGQRANRNALGPSQGLKTVKEEFLCEKKHRVILFGVLLFRMKISQKKSPWSVPFGEICIFK